MKPYYFYYLKISRRISEYYSNIKFTLFTHDYLPWRTLADLRLVLIAHSMLFTLYLVRAKISVLLMGGATRF
jgi:hypothetical protein